MDDVQRTVARSEIRALIDRYAVIARDHASWEEMSKVFANNAVYRLPNGKAVTPQELSQVVQGAEAKYIRHHVTTVDINLVSSEEAMVESYYIAITDSASPDHWGCWKDTVRKDQKSGLWKIQDRTLVPDGGVAEGWYMQVYGKSHRTPGHVAPHSL